MKEMHPMESEVKEFGLGELIVILRRRKWLIILLAVFCTVIAGAWASIAPKRYDAIVVLSPVSTSSSAGGGISSLGSQLGGLASMAGISGTGDAKKSESIAVLQSEALTERYIQSANLLPVLYSSKWDAQKAQWKPLPQKDIPTLWKANQYFKKNVRTVSIDAKSGLVTLIINWTDAKVAAKWANDLVRMANDFLRNRAITESERNIAYLNDESTKTSVVEVRRAIYSILEQEINKAMLARGSDEYAFRILDPAVPPEKQSSPLLLNWLMLGMLGGLFVSISLVLTEAALKR